MPSVIVTEIWDGRQGSFNEQRERDYVRTFKVITDTPTLGPDVIRTANGVPRVFSPYITPWTVDFGSWCREVSCRQLPEDPYTWSVEARYSSRIERPDINIVENPLLRPAEIRWSNATVTKPAWKDRGGRAIMTATRERFDPPVEREEQRLVLSVVKNFRRYDALHYLSYCNAVNSDVYLGMQPGRAKLTSVSGERLFENGIYYWRISAEIHFRVQIGESAEAINDPDLSAEAWAAQVLHQGFFEKKNGQIVLARDLITGAPVTAPILLTEAGERLPAGDDPVFKTFHLYPSKPFNALYLP